MKNLPFLKSSVWYSNEVIQSGGNFMLDNNQIDSLKKLSFGGSITSPPCPLEGHFKHMIPILQERGGGHLTHLTFLKALFVNFVAIQYKFQLISW
jgi:hypothetical protein